jgi:NAD(P)H-flavin reductase
MSPADAALAPMTPVPFRVADRRQETEDTWTLELEPQNGRSLPAFQPGQFSMLYAFGAGEVPISVSGDLSAADGRLVHTIRAVGAVTRALCACEPGQAVGARGPFGTPWPVADAEGADVVVAAGGVGLAPLRSFVYHLLSNRERFGNVAILYGARTPADMLYPGELESWRGRFDAQVEVTVDSAPAAWRGRVGVVTKLIPRAEVDPAKAIALVCGPEVMMRFTAAALEERGLAKERIHLSLERNMHCAIGMCGHCQFREHFICMDGPVFPLPVVEPLMRAREL